jgi:hypothetical protein
MSSYAMTWIFYIFLRLLTDTFLSQYICVMWCVMLSAVIMWSNWSWYLTSESSGTITWCTRMFVLMLFFAVYKEGGQAWFRQGLTVMSSYAMTWIFYILYSFKTDTFLSWYICVMWCLMSSTVLMLWRLCATHERKSQVQSIAARR